MTGIRRSGPPIIVPRMRPSVRGSHLSGPACPPRMTTPDRIPPRTLPIPRPLSAAPASAGPPAGAMSGSGVGTAATTVVGSGEGELDGVVTVSTVFDTRHAHGVSETMRVGPE